MLLWPVGFVRVQLSDEEVKKAWPGAEIEGIVEVLPEFEECLDGIDGFSHLILIAWLDRVTEAERRVLKAKPKRLARLGVPLDLIPEVGVFCTDSPHRPNPIAISTVRLVKREGRHLHVSGLDLFDGTPVLDIRGYTPDRAVEGLGLPKWYTNLMELAEKYAGERPAAI